MRSFVSPQSSFKRGTAAEPAEMNATQATASVICDKYALLRRRIQTMEIDAASNPRFLFCLRASPLDFVCTQSLMSTHT